MLIITYQQLLIELLNEVHVLQIEYYLIMRSYHYLFNTVMRKPVGCMHFCVPVYTRDKAILTECFRQILLPRIKVVLILSSFYESVCSHMVFKNLYIVMHTCSP